MNKQIKGSKRINQDGDCKTQPETENAQKKSKSGRLRLERKQERLMKVG